MKVKKLFKPLMGVFAMLGVLILAGGTTASALSGSDVSLAMAINPQMTLGLVHEQFSARGFPTFYRDNFTNPPQIGQKFTLEESVHALNGTVVGDVIGSSHIECTIIGFTPMPPTLQFACKAKFTFTNGGTLKAVTSFNFDPAHLPALYDALILSGTGVYAGAVGVVHVTDPGPGNPTDYAFDFYHL